MRASSNAVRPWTDRTPEQIERHRERAKAIRDKTKAQRMRLAQQRSVERQAQRRANIAAGLMAPHETETPAEQERIRRDIAQLSADRHAAAPPVVEGSIAAELEARARADENARKVSAKDKSRQRQNSRVRRKQLASYAAAPIETADDDEFAP